MDSTLERQILANVGKYFTSKEGKARGKVKDPLGGKIRSYRLKYKDGKLTPISALSLLLEVDLIKNIEYKNL